MKIIYSVVAAIAVIGLATSCTTTTASPPQHSAPTQQQPTTQAPPTAPPPAPSPTPTLIGTWSGTGNQNTPSFSAPASGNYVVSWSYSGNTDPQFGGPNNFIIENTDSSADALGLPNDIQSSGSGSTEVTMASGTESFNVQATGQWTITVNAAP